MSQNYTVIHFLNKSFLSKFSSGHVEDRFDNRAEKFLPTVAKFLVQSSKLIENICFTLKKFQNVLSDT